MKAWDQKDSTAHKSQGHSQVRKGRERKDRKQKQKCKQTKPATCGKKRKKKEGVHSSL